MQERVYKKVKIDHPHLSFVIRPEVVAIGSSTGGPSALTELLPLFPADFPLPILIVQHMPRLFTKTLADSLARKSHLQIVEAQDGMIVKPGTVFIAPGGFQMKIVRRDRGQVTVQITDDPPENHCKPSADYLFRSVAQIYQDKAIGVILTGMGSDGTLGLRLMKRLGAQIIGQNRETCVVWGMPRAAIEAGVVDIELPLNRIAPELIRCAGDKR
jgi:two-component system chemotaxis response regulator CheB